MCHMYSDSQKYLNIYHENYYDYIMCNMTLFEISLTWWNVTVMIILVKFKTNSKRYVGNTCYLLPIYKHSFQKMLVHSMNSCCKHTFISENNPKWSKISYSYNNMTDFSNRSYTCNEYYAHVNFQLSLKIDHSCYLITILIKLKNISYNTNNIFVKDVYSVI